MNVESPVRVMSPEEIVARGGGTTQRLLFPERASLFAERAMDPHVDPVADDLASVTLDLLLADTGLQRHGVNLMLLFGDPDAAPDPGSGDG